MNNIYHKDGYSRKLEKENQKLKATIKALEVRGEGWQPIEGFKPVDFQEYLIGRFGGENIETIKQCTCIQGDWIVIGMFSKFINPTHVMLLPQPPKEN